MEFENKKVGNTTTSSPFCKVFTDPKSALEVDNTKKKVIGGEGIRNNKKLPLVEIDGDDLSSANILRKYTGSDVLLCNNSFIKPPPPSSKNKNFRRKRTTSEEEEEDDDEDDSVADGLNLIHHNNMTSKTNPPLFPKPIDGNNNNHKLLHFSTTGGPTTKTKTKASSSLFHFESSRHIQVEGCDNNATAILETETEFSKDSRSMRERVLKQASEEAAALLMKKGPAAAKNKRANSGSVVDDEKPLYKGILGYTDYRAAFRRDQTFSDKASGAHGPHRTSSHIRVSAWFDYQPDVCKDYKETGYCGFGDSCNFLHDRGGWQMETEWEEAEKVRKRDFSLGVGHDDLDEAGPEEGALPFACSICRGPFVDPVVTTCKHYFCQQCALEHRAKNKKCFVCNKPTRLAFSTLLRRYGKRWLQRGTNMSVHSLWSIQGFVTRHAKNKKCFVCNKPTLGIFSTAQEISKKMAAEGK